MWRSFVLACYFLALPAMASVSVEVVDTWPGTDQTLVVEQKFYVLLRYTSDSPVRIYVRPYTDGKQSNAITHGAVTLPAGSNETLGWFAMRSEGTVDQVRISTDTENSGYPEHVLTMLVKLAWKPDGMMTDTGQPEWIERINQRNDELWLAEQKKAAEETPVAQKGLGAMIIAILFGIPVVTLILCVLAIARWKGIWLNAGGVPLVMFVLWLAKFLFDIARDPTSHNLWPFELLIWSSVTLFWLLTWFVARKLIK